jgi:hypothetical protein
MRKLQMVFIGLVLAVSLLFATGYHLYNKNKKVEVDIGNSFNIYKLDVNHALNLAMASNVVSESGVFTGRLRSVDSYLCSSCRDSELTYFWTARYKPLKLTKEGGKVLILCDKDFHEDKYYIFGIKIIGDNSVDFIAADIKGN